MQREREREAAEREAEAPRNEAKRERKERRGKERAQMDTEGRRPWAMPGPADRSGDDSALRAAGRARGAPDGGTGTEGDSEGGNVNLLSRVWAGATKRGIELGR